MSFLTLLMVGVLVVTVGCTSPEITPPDLDVTPSESHAEQCSSFFTLYLQFQTGN